MTYPPQQPGAWQDPAWPAPEQPTQPYGDPFGGAPTSSPGYAVPPGSPTGYGPPFPGYGYGPMAPQKTNSMAITALVLALVGLGCPVTAPIGAIFGHVARRQIRQTGEGGDGMALAGIIVGWIVTALWLAYVAVVVVAVVLAAGSSSGSTY